MPEHHRRLFALTGSVAETRAAALRYLGALPDEAVLWVGPERERFVSRTPTEVRALLGGAFQVVVLDLHPGLDPDLLGQVHGFVWGGGRLILRMPVAPPRSAALAVYPYTIDQVGTRSWERLVRFLHRHDAIVAPHPIAPVPLAARGTAEQEALVEALATTFTAQDPVVTVLTADRGRGKSAALGLAVSRARSSGELRVEVTGADPAAATEILRFAGDPGLRWLPPLEVGDPDVLLIDEAARLPLPVLNRLVDAHPRARIALATTTRGYEGTGRGFALRFVAGWREDRPLVERTLITPIRFSADDPLEAWVLGVLGLEPAPASPRPDRIGPVDPADLADDEPRLREVFGLLAEAHYRTTPSDLYRVLDAPNLALHAVDRRGHTVAVTVVAREGGLPPELSANLARGESRIRGHALADTLICHAGEVEAGTLRMVRSVRIATAPDARREGHARALVDHVHQSYDVDLFGTLFGATPELIRFRRALGYAVVRLGSSPGDRSGEPAAVMIRPVSEPARVLVARLRGVLARELPLQLALLAGEGEPVDDALAEELARDLPPAAPLSDPERDAIVAAWLAGVRPYEAAAFAIRAHVEARSEALAALPALDRALIEAKVLRLRGWRQLGGPVPAAMRALRRAVRQL